MPLMDAKFMIVSCEVELRDVLLTCLHEGNVGWSIGLTVMRPNDIVALCMDNANITRKRSKPDKHGHEIE
ncbi:hypothetical protein Tco_1180773 [Tanacetum coccineum]